MLRSRTRDENGRGVGKMRLQIHQLLLREVQNVQKNYENLRVQMNAWIRRDRLNQNPILIKLEWQPIRFKPRCFTGNSINDNLNHYVWNTKLIYVTRIEIIVVIVWRKSFVVIFRDRCNYMGENVENIQADNYYSIAWPCSAFLLSVLQRIYIVSEPELYLARYCFTNFLYVPWNFRNKAMQKRNWTRWKRGQQS